MTMGAMAFAAFVVTHWLWFRIRPPQRRSRAMLGLMAMCLLGAGNFGVGAVLTFGALWILYMPFYYTIQTSISISMLVKLLDGPATLKHESGLRETLSLRLETMVANGYLTPDHELTPRGRFVAASFGWVKEFWKLGPGG